MSDYLFDRRSDWTRGAGTHALIVGVSTYTNLPAHNSTSRDPIFGLRSVASSALSAYRIAQWLINHADELAIPLVTLKLMISPSDLEVENEPALKALSVPCDVNAFLRAANEWRGLVRDDSKSSTFFYFSGLGKELARSEPILLFADFGDQFGPILRGAVSVTNLVYGLSPTQRQLNIARTQLFFIDSSRRSLENVLQYELSNPTSVFDADVLGIDDRCAPVFYAAQPGAQAFSIKGQQSLFSSALLECLDGAAAVPALDQDASSAEPLAWEVTVSSLIDGLADVLARQRAERQKEYEMFKVRQDYAVGGVVRDAAIHRLDHPPSVAVRFSVELNETVPTPASIEIFNDLDEVVEKLQVDTRDWSTEVKLPAGYYRATLAGETTRTRTRLVRPPHYEWKLRA